MGEAVQEPARVGIHNLEDDVSIPAPGRRGHDVLVEGEGDEDDGDEQVDDGADGAHGLWDLPLMHLAHVLALQAGLHKGRPQPADHGVGGGEGDAAEGQRGDERLAIALEGVGDDAGAGEEEREEAQLL